MRIELIFQFLSTLSLFSELADVYLSQNFPKVLTIHSGNKRLKVGIVLRSGTQKWKRQRATTFMGSNNAESVAAKAKMASFNFKALYIDRQ